MKSMMGEVKTACSVAFGDKYKDPVVAYNDWAGRKTMPNKREFKLYRCVNKRVSERQIATLKRSLQQRLRHFNLVVVELYVGQPHTYTDGLGRVNGGLYLLCHER